MADEAVHGGPARRGEAGPERGEEGAAGVSTVLPGTLHQLEQIKCLLRIDTGDLRSLL